MNKPEIKKGSFSVDDIHKIREYNYEKTKNMSSEELIKHFNTKASKIREKIMKNREEKMAM